MVIRRRALAAAVLVVAGLAVFGTIAVNLPKSPEQRELAAQALLAGVDVGASAQPGSLLATKALADFGVGNDVRLVRVRIVDRLDLTVDISTARDIVLAEAPKLCLVGPDSAPDDAGLEDRCWGEPDLSGLFAAQAGWRDVQRVLRADQPVAIGATISRGDIRCDYAPGRWLLQVKLNPLIDGVEAGARYLDDVAFEVPLPEHGPLRYVPIDQSRFCGLATGIYRDQGEPQIIE